MRPRAWVITKVMQVCIAFYSNSEARRTDRNDKVVFPIVFFLKRGGMEIHISVDKKILTVEQFFAGYGLRSPLWAFTYLPLSSSHCIFILQGDTDRGFYDNYYTF